MSKHKFPKSVSFNLKNDEDLAILEYVKKRNFSGYVKKLILSDMENNNVVIKKSPKKLSRLEQLRQDINDYTKNDSNSKSDS